MPAKNLFKMMACIALASSCVFVEAAREPVDYVNTGIGSISHMLVPTFRTVQRPHAMFRFNAPYGDFTQDAVSACWIQHPAHRQSRAASPCRHSEGRARGRGHVQPSRPLDNPNKQPEEKLWISR